MSSVCSAKDTSCTGSSIIVVSILHLMPLFPCSLSCSFDCLHCKKIVGQIFNNRGQVLPTDENGRTELNYSVFQWPLLDFHAPQSRIYILIFQWYKTKAADCNHEPCSVHLTFNRKRIRYINRPMNSAKIVSVIQLGKMKYNSQQLCPADKHMTCLITMTMLLQQLYLLYSQIMTPILD